MRTKSGRTGSRTRRRWGLLGAVAVGAGACLAVLSAPPPLVPPRFPRVLRVRTEWVRANAVDMSASTLAGAGRLAWEFDRKGDLYAYRPLTIPELLRLRVLRQPVRREWVAWYERLPRSSAETLRFRRIAPR